MKQAHDKIADALTIVVKGSGPIAVKRICTAIQLAVKDGAGWDHNLDPLLLQMAHAKIKAEPDFLKRQAELLAKDEEDRAKAREGRGRRKQLEDQNEKQKRLDEEAEKQRIAAEKQRLDEEKKALEEAKKQFEAEKKRLELKPNFTPRVGEARDRDGHKDRHGNLNIDKSENDVDKTAGG